jgi:hypothetical protein
MASKHRGVPCNAAVQRMPDGEKRTKQKVGNTHLEVAIKQ